jgi:hypothetical protein
MGFNQIKTGSINGSPIVGQGSGQSTGDSVYRTSDGRYWTEPRGVVSSILPTGATIATIIK